MKAKISLIVPIYNEAANSQNLLQILSQIDSQKFDAELIAVDDGSSDQSAELIEQLAQQDQRIRLLSFTRNFGKEAAIQAGLEHSNGDAVIVIDADLQHPPELIPQMLAIWQQGIWVVDAVKQDRGDESWLSRQFAQVFYGMFKFLAKLDINGQSDYKLLDRKVVDQLLRFPEKNRFFRGMVGWAKFPSAQLPFEVAQRSDAGGSKWSKVKLIRYAINNITNFSSLPLKLVTYLGLFTFVAGLVVALNSLLQKIQGRALDGFTTVNILIVLIGGAILISLGIIGHYLALMFDELKARPTYLIKTDRQKK